MELNDEVGVHDEVKVEVTPSQTPDGMVSIVVDSEHGIFKGGRHYQKGEVARVAESAAANFIRVGDAHLALEAQPNAQ